MCTAAFFESLESRRLFALTTIATFDSAVVRQAIAQFIDGEGNLFGTSFEGGDNGGGVVWELSKNSNTPIVLASFPEGVSDAYGLAQDAAGNLFGLTVFGGDNNDGIVYEIVKGSGTITPLASIDFAYKYPDRQIGDERSGTITIDASGNLFCAVGSGAAATSQLFELPAGSNTLTTLATFDGTTGRLPQGLILDRYGNLFGTTQSGGAFFEWVKGSNQITKLPSTGGFAVNPVMDDQGNLYTPTIFGGSSNDGAIFKLPAGGNTATAIASFTSQATTGVNPNYIVRDSAGNIFGQTDSGAIFVLKSGSDTPVKVAQLVQNDLAALFALSADDTIYLTVTTIFNNHASTIYKVDTNVTGSGGISGTVFNDKNSNGTFDAGDSAAAGQSVYIDVNNNNVHDFNEPLAATDDVGQYSFSGLVDATYHIKLMMPVGYRKTLPASGTPGYDVAVSGDTIDGKDFGITTNILLAGKVADDATQTPIPNVLINIISNNTIVATRTTDANGKWQVKGLSAGTGSAELVVPDGYIATSPADGKCVGSMTSGQQNANLNFGLHQIAPVPTVEEPQILAARDTSLNFFA